MTTNHRNQRLFSFIGILAAFLIVAVLVAVMRSYNRPPALEQSRAGQRRAALTELRDANAKGLNNYDWQDQGKGIVRLKIDRAMELTLEEYKNPAAARSNLIARAEKAFAAPPPAPAAPNKYE
jgi:hypothetical protein